MQGPSRTCFSLRALTSSASRQNRRTPARIKFLQSFMSTTTTTVPENTEKSSSILGTAPKHTLYALLYHPDSPQTYPPKVNTPSLMALTLAVRPLGGLANFYHPCRSPSSASHLKSKTRPENHNQIDGSEEDWPPIESAQPGPPALKVYAAPRPRHPRPRVAQFSTPNFTNFDFHYDLSLFKPARASDGALLLVCTHGQRDCRCGEHGGALFEALQREIDSRRRSQNPRIGLGEEEDGRTVWDRIEIGEVAHVGGHKYAANVLAFPSGDWLGNLRAEHAPALLDGVASQLRALARLEASESLEHSKSAGSEETTPTETTATIPPLIADAKHWRGRMGLNKEELGELLVQYNEDRER